MGVACAAAIGTGGWSVHAQTGDATASAHSSLAVLDFELVDEQNNPLTKAAQEVRLCNVTLQLQQELAQHELHRVVDPAPSHALQRQLREQQEFLYRCDDCAERVGKLLGVDLVVRPGFIR